MMCVGCGGRPPKAAAALSFTFVTPTGSTSGGEACAAEADITTSAGSISVTLKNLLTPAQIISAGQAVSDLSFTLSNAPGTQGTLTASGQLANIGAGGSVSNVGGSPVRLRKRSLPTAVVPIASSLMRRSLFCGRGGSKLDDLRMVSRNGAPLAWRSLPAIRKLGTKRSVKAVLLGCW
jgi:hypothetical protein